MLAIANRRAASARPRRRQSRHSARRLGERVLIIDLDRRQRLARLGMTAATPVSLRVLVANRHCAKWSSPRGPRPSIAPSPWICRPERSRPGARRVSFAHPRSHVERRQYAASATSVRAGDVRRRSIYSQSRRWRPRTDLVPLQCEFSHGSLSQLLQTSSRSRRAKSRAVDPRIVLTMLTRATISPPGCRRSSEFMGRKFTTPSSPHVRSPRRRPTASRCWSMI